MWLSQRRARGRQVGACRRSKLIPAAYLPRSARANFEMEQLFIAVLATAMFVGGYAIGFGRGFMLHPEVARARIAEKRSRARR